MTRQRLENTSGTEVDPATEGTLSAVAAALASNGTDTLQTEQQTPVGVEDSTGTQVDPATETTLSAVAGALASNATDHLHVQEDTPLDVSAATVTTNATVQNNASGVANGAALAANGSVTVLSAGQPGGERLVGQVVSSGAYDVVVDWKDSAGTVIRSETINSGLTGGTWYDVNQQMKSPYADLKVVDTSSASQTVDGTAHVR